MHTNQDIQAQARDRAQDFAAAQSYVGIEYVPDYFDCAHLFFNVQKKVFGRTITLPNKFDTHALGRAGQAAQIRAARDALASRIDGPQHGCAVLIVCATERGDCWHIGTVFEHKGEHWVLHNSRVMGNAALNRLSHFAKVGNRVEGFYTCN
jgi:hypothetical protein